MNNLADLYYYSVGTNKDYYQAFYWHKKAAEAGNSDAMLNVGSMYLRGEGTPKDLTRAK